MNWNFGLSDRKSDSKRTDPAKLKTNRLFELAGPDRGTGQTTGLAHAAISAAILTPNTWIVVIDHHNTPDSNKRLMFLCKELTTELGYKFFQFEFKVSTGQARIRCNIFGE